MNITTPAITPSPDGLAYSPAPPVMRIDLPVKPALLPHCRKLVAAGANPETILHVYRGETLCFVPGPLGKFAGMATEESDTKSVHLTKYREVAFSG